MIDKVTIEKQILQEAGLTKKEHLLLLAAYMFVDRRQAFLERHGLLDEFELGRFKMLVSGLADSIKRDVGG